MLHFPRPLPIRRTAFSITLTVSICGLAESEGTLVTEEETGDECETQSGDHFIASSIARSTSGWPRMLS